MTRAFKAVFATVIVMFLTGCATVGDLTTTVPVGRWQFATDLDKTSACLVGAMNAEWQPKSNVEQFFGRSIAHSIVTVEPGRVNHIVHEHIAPTTIWVVVVTRDDSNHAIATAHILSSPAGSDAKLRIERAATICGGK